MHTVTAATTTRMILHIVNRHDTSLVQCKARFDLRYDMTHDTLVYDQQVGDNLNFRQLFLLLSLLRL